MCRFYVLFLSSLLWLPLGASWLLFKVEQKKIHREIKTRIKTGVSENDLVVVRIDENLETTANTDFQRMHAREFRYRGVMYDIVRQEKKQGYTLYWCILDHAETQLFAELENWVNQAMGKSPMQQHNYNQLLNFYASLFLEQSHWELSGLAQLYFKFPMHLSAALLNFPLQPPQRPPDFQPLVQTYI